METTALRFHEFGDPQNVLRLETVTVEPPGPGDVLLRLLASPVNPSDLGSIGGSYGELPSLPAVAGREGVGEIVETGTGVASLTPGQRVLFPEGHGVWQALRTVPADTLVPVPEEVPTEQAAMATINPPTAWLLLEHFRRLDPGDWVIQNAANSAVGHFVIQLCRERGLRTLNLVRRPEWIDRLKKEGADVVIVEDSDLPTRIRNIVGAELPLLGLNSVGGTSAATLIKCLGEGGTLVTFGGMTGDAIRFPTRHLIFNDIRLVGFWLHRWKQNHSTQENRELLGNILSLMGKGILHAPIQRAIPLADFSEALKLASAPGREGKILFKF